MTDRPRPDRDGVRTLVAVSPRVSLVGTIGMEHIDAICRKLRPVARLSRPTDVEFDLGGLVEACPAALAMLVATARSLQARGVADPLASWSPPSGAAIETWLGRPGIDALLEDRAGSGIGVGKDPPGCSGCEAFSDYDGIDRANAALTMTLHDRLQAPDSTLGTIGFMLSELAGNVLRHAQIGEGVAAAWAYTERGCFELAVADCGVGIAASLASNPEYAYVGDDHAAALREAVAPGVTSERGGLGGLGLYLLRLAVVQNGGEIVIRSGNARLTQREHIETTMGLPYHRGTLVAVRAYIDRPFDLELVYRWLEQPGGAGS
jgi:hypothetical protein